MNPLVMALAGLAFLNLLGLVLSATALSQVRSLARSLRNDSDSPTAGPVPAVEELRHGLDGLAAQLHELQQSPPQTVIAAPVRSGLNLAKRSHALRLHRHGNSAAEIASALEIPQQEVELLLKVHRIVINNL